ncbi:nucleoside-diphosphate sugar epimerase/dehydratase [Prosthecomicrobium sp. N25]|uniref:nucleoside-diphosphate sugar epimerase/dehydratase n=1 Tax=Prosthecomicrobium sp. N25 TaxID=3129254 RepID=UPI0030771039
MNRQSRPLKTSSIADSPVQHIQSFLSKIFNFLGDALFGQGPKPARRLSLRSRVRAAVRAPLRFPALYATDLVLSGVSLFLATVMRLGLDAANSGSEAFGAVVVAWPMHTAICAIVFPMTGLYMRTWKFASLGDIFQIFKSVFLASLIFVAVIFLYSRLQAIPRSVIAMNAVFLVSLITLTRLSFKLDRMDVFGTGARTQTSFSEMIPVLLVGAGHSADLYLRALQRDRNAQYWPVGFLDVDSAQRDLLLRGVPILGGVDEFDAVMEDLVDRGQAPRHIIFTESPAVFGEGSAEALIERAERMGLTVSRLAPATELRSPREENRFQLRPIELADLLERPQITHDREQLSRLVHGCRVLVTGAGGSIGSELVRQVASLAPAEVVLIDNSEFNLYSIDLELAEKFRDVPRAAYLCNVRDAARVDEIMDRHRPELVFHAAALKHVPMVELNPCEGVLTNAIGTMNVAEATRRIGARAMVQVSTDKVVNPTSVMGATKRLAELYCQALELDDTRPATRGDTTRFMTVRFGNVLGSSGSLIPLFKRQLAQGGPLTVTDPEMKRFFMTIREAVELTLQASAHGLEKKAGRGEIFVLDMGEPIKIIDIARRVIKLAGCVPDDDIKIEIVGCRPGEKLFEELFDDDEKRVRSAVPGILGAVPAPVPLPTLREAFQRIRRAAEKGDAPSVFGILQDVLPGYRRGSSTPAPRRAASNTPVSGPAGTALPVERQAPLGATEEIQA